MRTQLYRLRTYGTIMSGKTWLTVTFHVAIQKLTAGFTVVTWTAST